MNVQLFAPGHDAGGVPARARFMGPTLRLEGEGVRLAIPVDRLTVKTGGFDGGQWLLEWAADGGRAAILLPPEPDRSRLLASAPPALAGQLAEQGRRHRWQGRRFRLGIGLIGASLLLPLVLVAVFWINSERIAGWAADQVSPARERQLGDLAFAQLRPTLKIVAAGPVPAMVGAIGGRLTAGSRHRYQWFVADSPEINAFAMPGGYVVIYTGLIKAADSAEEVAGVLAHEVRHVESRHSLKNLLHGLGWRAVLALVLGDVSGGVWTGMAERLGAMSYSRDLERQADLEGLQALRRAGIAPAGMVSFFTKLAKNEGSGIALLSSHPASDERLRTLRQAIADQGAYPAGALPYDWPALRAGLGRR